MVSFGSLIHADSHKTEHATSDDTRMHCQPDLPHDLQI